MYTSNFNSKVGIGPERLIAYLPTVADFLLPNSHLPFLGIPAASWSLNLLPSSLSVHQKEQIMENYARKREQAPLWGVTKNHNTSKTDLLLI